MRKENRKTIRTVMITIAVLVITVIVAVYFTVFLLAKQKKIFINKWFVNEEKSTIGVDVSSYQADIDMGELKAQNIQFIYIKASEGSKTKDRRFAENWKNAKDEGLLSGAYHFFSYDSDGITQADNFIDAVGSDLTGRLIPAVDVEYYGYKEQNPPEKEDVIRELRIYLERIEKEYGVKPLIYTRPDINKKYLKGEFDEYKKWISSLYQPLSWVYTDDWYIWQYLNRGELKGYTGGEKYIDLNVLNKEKSLEDLIIGSAGGGSQQQRQQEVHVAVSGSDEEGTGTQDAPYATVSAASEAAPGAAIIVHEGGVWPDQIGTDNNFLELGYGLSYGSGFQPEDEPERISDNEI